MHTATRFKIRREGGRVESLENVLSGGGSNSCALHRGRNQGFSREYSKCSIKSEN